MTSDLDMLVGCFRRYREYRNSLPPEAGLGDSPWDIAPQESVATVIHLLLEHPVREALKGKVRDIGWRIATSGGMVGMLDMHDQVEAAMPDSSEWVGDLLELWWHGVGNWRV